MRVPRSRSRTPAAPGPGASPAPRTAHRTCDPGSAVASAGLPAAGTALPAARRTRPSDHDEHAPGRTWPAGTGSPAALPRPAGGNRKTSGPPSRRARPSPWRTAARAAASRSPGSAPGCQDEPRPRHHRRASAGGPACRRPAPTGRNLVPPPASPDPTAPRRPTGTGTTAATPSNTTAASARTARTPANRQGTPSPARPAHPPDLPAGTARTDPRSPLPHLPAAPGGQVRGDAGGQHPPAVHQPGLRRQIAQAHRLRGAHAVLDDGVLAVQHAGELGVVAAGHAADPAGGGDVGDDDGVPPPGGLLEGGQVPGLPPRRPGAPHDPPQPGGPAGGAGEQVGDLGDVLVLLHHSVLVHGGLPRGGGQQPDRVLIGAGDGPAGGEQHGAAPGAQ